MFEALLEKILLSHFGRFLSGLDRANIHLGVWSGNLIIENVSLKPEVIEMLELPLQLRFSHIEKFQVNVPWSKISQQSVEIFIQNVFVIVSQKSRSDWKPNIDKYEVIVQCLKKTLEEFLMARTKFLAGKEKDPNAGGDSPNSENPNMNLGGSSSMQASVDKQGILDRLIVKIIDNVQIVIQNIHVRYECDLEKPGFSWGITLADLRLFTTESQYKNRVFFDRSDPKNKETQLFKKAELTKFGLYWNSNDLQFFSSLSHNEIKAKIYNFSLYEHDDLPNKSSYSKRIDYIVSINCELRVLIALNPAGVVAAEECQLSLSLKTLNFLIRNSQLQDCIRMSEFFQQYRLAFAREKAEHRKKPNSQSDQNNKFNTELDMKNRFDSIFILVLKKKGPLSVFSEAKELEKFLKEEETEEFNQIIHEIEVELLFKWVKEAFYKAELERLSAKQKQFGAAVFCGSSSKKNLKRQRLFVEGLLGSLKKPSAFEVKEPDANAETTGYSVKSFGFDLEELNIRVTKKLKKYDEGLIFKLRKLTLGIDFTSDGFGIKSEIREIGIDLINNTETKTEIVIPILTPRSSEFYIKHTSFLELTLRKKGNFLETQMELGSLEIIYYPSIMLKLLAYFSVQSNEEGVRNIALEEYRYIQSTTSQLVKEKDLDMTIKVRVLSPTLIIPFLQYNDSASPCFVLQLGDIELKNKENNNIKDDIYQKFALNFQSIRLFFYSSITFFKLSQKYGDLSFPAFLNQDPSRHERFQIIEQLKLQVIIQRVKVISAEIASMKVLVDFERVRLNLSQKRLNDLMKFTKVFNNPDLRTQELLQTETKPLFEHAFRKGMLKRKEHTFKNWSSYYVVFNGGYLYFFLSPKDVKYSGYVYIKESVVTECSGEIGVPFSFKVSSKTQDTFLACANHNDLKSWVKILQKKIHEFSFKSIQFSVVQNRKSEAQQQKVKKKFFFFWVGGPGKFFFF